MDPRVPKRIATKIKALPTGCWLWTGYRTAGGYGRVSVYGALALAHRAVYELLRHGIPGGMHVCHKCDNPSCVNPEHMFLGDAKANMVDMAIKGRGGKLTLQQVREIRAARGRETGRALAARYGVSPALVSKIQLRRCRTEVQDQP